MSVPEPTVVAWLSSFALVVDLANGAPETTALRGTLVAALAARELGLGDDEAAAAVYGSLFRYLGCTSYAHEEAGLFGNEHEAARLFAPLDRTDFGGIARAAMAVDTERQSALARAVRMARVATEGVAFRRGYERAQCEAAVLLTSRLDVTPLVRDALASLYERWDGEGGPASLAGASIPVAARVLHVAREATVHLMLRGGRGCVVRCLERRAGGQLDPEMCRALLASPTFLDALEQEPLWDAVVAALTRHLPRAFTSLPSLDALVEVFGDFADQKCPWFLGHARRVASLAKSAATVLNLDPTTTTLLVRAAWLHDVGLVSVPNRILETPGPIGAIEWEKLRLHGYVGERICRHLDRRLANLVGQHHERADGRGSSRSASLDDASAVLCAADVCAALGADRPHRPRLSDDEQVRALEKEVSDGRLRADAVRAVLSSRKQRPMSRPSRAEKLSEREREVLSLVARGLSNKEVAQKLAISARTVQAHTIRVYDKLGVRSRAGAALRAAELDLLD